LAATNSKQRDPQVRYADRKFQTNKTIKTFKEEGRINRDSQTSRLENPEELQLHHNDE
jgi:hypothetical protein